MELAKFGLRVAVYLAIAAFGCLGQQGAPKFKAIWEPVNYPYDAELRDVFFVSADEGWVVGHVKSDAGEGGVLLHTSDGGLHWEAQLGDPHSATRGFETVFFLDAKHGWASQWGGGALLRTLDGSTWESVYQFGNPHDVVFTTADVGFYVDGERLFRTEDGGHTWKQVFTCGTSVQVNGLTRATGCRFSTLSFSSANVGYAGTNALPNNAAALARTEDGGLSWNISRFIPDADVQERGLCFTDENTGFARIGGNKLAATSDAGQSWRGVPANVLNGWIRFADREVSHRCQPA
jgi:photosystem II stability/assembly factor-like uncharacterized protein